MNQKFINKAEKLYMETLQIRKRYYLDSDPRMIAVNHNIAEMYGAQKRDEEASIYYDRVME